MKVLSKEEWQDEYWKEIGIIAEEVITKFSFRYGVWNSMLGTDGFRDGLWEKAHSSKFTSELTSAFFVILNTNNLSKIIEKIRYMLKEKPDLRVFPLAANLAMTYDIEEKINTLLEGS